MTRINTGKKRPMQNGKKRETEKEGEFPKKPGSQEARNK
jgi:hypothetical protein